MAQEVTREKLAPWICETCGAAGDVAVPPLVYSDPLVLAEQAHGLMSPECGEPRVVIVDLDREED